ncbi:hypothetical protein E4U43_001878 [Claviceps pusilla]|uniref:BIR-domain-containing protein n=1 Tax=Claviceps pusilla TaxID=123648 RepID=A0A9P7T3G7_9HYPO|nr:hypothetical protein E4U43_001878 [Claviceps pusilla]
MDQYFTYEARLASFQKGFKKSVSTATGRGRALSWPHKQIAPASLAKAGFYFEPYAENPDNCACFLCGKGMDGWEEGDDPLQEHLKHSPTCGWAIHVAIEADIEEYSKEDPGLPHMVEGRRATFADKWPHEARKGWKCKTKQLVEAGWNYTPTEESDDMATCAYCQLGLDGWEPNDKPYDEHYNRSPNCSFFALLNQFGGMKKKTTRAKAARGSKASRLSAQSVATAASDIASTADTTADAEDSVLTTTSTLSHGAKKSAGRKKATTTKVGSKTTKSKKSRVVEQGEEEQEQEQEEENVEAHEQVSVQPKPATKLARGKKRASDAMEDSIVFMSEAPVPKKRSAASRDTTRMDTSTLTSDDDEMVTAPKRAGRARSSSTRSSGKPSASMASLRAAPEFLTDDEEIERQLEAELDRFTTDDEIDHDSDSERRTAKNKTKNNRNRNNNNNKSNKSTNTAVTGTGKLQDYAMFDPGEIKTDDEALDQELLNLRAEMEVGEPRQELPVPKKGRKAGTTRKTSKQTKTKKAPSPSPSPSISPMPSPSPLPSSPFAEIEADPELEPESEIGQIHGGDRGEVSIDSTDTVVKKTGFATSPPTKRPRGRATKTSTASNTASKSADAPVKRGRGRPAKVVTRSSSPLNSPALEVEQLDDFGSEIHEDEEDIDDVRATRERMRSRPVARQSASPPAAARVSRSRLLAEAPSTPTKVVSPAPSARQPALSPSQSPQSSDAENQPPSSAPVVSAKTRRVVLAPVAATPMQGSPTRPNVLAAGLQSQTPWTAIDLDAVLSTSGLMVVDKENAVGGGLLKQGKELTSPEKQMTLEEWIHFNAGEAEKKLKHECEAMVTQFEREGTRAMNVLEGLTIE